MYVACIQRTHVMIFDIFTIVLLTTAVFKVWNATEHHQFILGPPGELIC